MYSYEEALKLSTEYFGEELPAKVFVDKYALRNEKGEILEATPDAMHKRLAKEFARIEKKKFAKPLEEQEIYGALKNYLSIVPQGSPIFGIGNPYKTVTLSNCYVLTTPQDSYNSILDTDKELVNISKRRGGVGIDLSNLRPVNAPTKNAAGSSTGIPTWMERYSNSIREVGNLGRRGALLLSLSIHHPDIEKFISIKNDETKVTGANISVRLSDEFLNAVKSNKDVELRFPVDSKNVHKTLKARDLWKQIIHNAWKRAEPGLLFWDNIIRESLPDCYAAEGFATKSTNPCLRNNAKLLTPGGIKELKDLDVGDKIWSSEGWTTILKKWSTGVKEVFRYRTTFGYVELTSNHKIMSNGEKVEIGDAENIDVLRGFANKRITLSQTEIANLSPQDIMDGLVIGDGGFHKASDMSILYIGENDQDYFKSEISSLISNKKANDIAFGVNTQLNTNVLVKMWNREVPQEFLFGNKEKICGFLRGLYSANGSICGDRIALKSTSRKLVDQVQLMLNSIGILSYITTNKPSLVKFENGEYLCKKSYDLNIYKDRHKFAYLIGFIQKYKTISLHKICEKKGRLHENLSKDIVQIEKIGEEEVFDITVSNSSHTFWCNGFNVSNCSELPLSELESCRLTAINLMSCVEEKFTKNASFNYKKFYELAQLGQRFMDNLIDLELECIDRILAKIESDPESLTTKLPEKTLWEKIRHFCETGRRTGLGITGLGDTLAALNIKYGSDKSIDVTERIYRTLKFGAYRSSVDMAKELGAFPIYQKEREKDNPYLKRLEEEVCVLVDQKDASDYIDAVSGQDILSDMYKYGRRNIALLTTAPTGTISTQSGYFIGDKFYCNISSGIEPVFKTSYVRRKKGNPGDKNFRSDFVDKVGDHWMEFPVYHSGLKAWMDVNGKDSPEGNPYEGATAEEILWTKRVKLQAAAQKHVDHSISSTVNLPADVSEEEVAKIYETAWETGNKGITIYRAGCRSGVLIEKKEEQEVDRPKELDCQVYHTQVNSAPYFVLVGMLDGKPYEIFAGKNGFLDKNVKAGKIIKSRKRHYKAIFEDETELSPITACCGEHEETITRLTSALLRSGADMLLIVQQLERVGGGLHSFAKGIARVLKKFIPDGTAEKGEMCPECKQETIIRKEGCLACVSCGYSKC